MSVIESWRQAELIAEISGEIVDGMGAACAFAADRARENAPERRGILKGDIDYRVEAHGNEVTGYVGVKKGKAFYGYFVELGTSKMAARPFLRPAVFGHAAEILRLIVGGR